MAFQVFATRWDSAGIVEELPARGLSFNLPLSDHGEAGFSATVGPGRNHWRAALSVATSGILIASDGVPVWAGRLEDESQTGPRTFDFRAREWGSFFATCPAPAPFTQIGTNDHLIQQRLIGVAQAVAGQDVGVILGSSLGAATSDLRINLWDETTVEEEFRRIGEAEGGPEWRFIATGTLAAPTRTLLQGDRLGSVGTVAVLEYVEETQDVAPPAPPPLLLGLGDLVPGPPPPPVPYRRGGNVVGHPARTVTPGFTVAIATGAGDQALQMRRTTSSVTLLAAGFPRRTKVTAYSDVNRSITLHRHAAADLAASRGLVTGYSLATYGNNPRWASVSPGDTVRVELDTDVYGGTRPLVFTTRILDIRVSVPDEGEPTVTYVIADLPGV